MGRFWLIVFTIYRKDLQLEIRTKEMFSSVLVFSLMVVFIFNFVFDPSPQLIKLVGPGIVWVSYTFTNILILNRSLIVERDGNTLDGLKLAPVGWDAIFASKLFGSFTMMLLVELLMIPIFILFYNFSLISIWFAIITLLGTFGFAIVGTIFSTIAIHTRAREVLLPILFLPIIVPILIGAVTTTKSIIGGDGWDDIQHWVYLLLAFDIVYLVVSSLAFEYLLEE